ncbi:hypothetical protein O6H91_Y113700 [Diphasiastrum complanatum]|nr:hypothetical protein O6H91_Y113700 [Diphasiastrum complanatum]
MHMSRRSPDAVNPNLINTACHDGSIVGALPYSMSPNLRGQEEPILGIASKRSLSALLDTTDDTGDGEVADDSLLYHVEKKRRLTVEQVRSLEISFELENKLEPERKLQLARELGLQPRQVAIWFQNRRARWKTKQLERDYGILKAAYDSLLSEKDKLKNEIASLNVKLRTSSKEIDQMIKREDADDQCNTVVKDPAWKPPNFLSLSEKVKLKQPTESEDQQLHSPVLSNEASSSSNGESTLKNSSEVDTHGLSSCSPCPIDMAFDQKAMCALQPGKLGFAGPAHHLLGGKERFGSVCNPHNYQQITFKPEDGSFQEESYCTPFFHLDEHAGWPWTSWD